MTETPANTIPPWPHVLKQGAIVGVLTAFLYALLFVIYAILRSSLVIAASAPPEISVTVTLVANAMAITVGAFSTTLLLSIATGLLGMATAALVKTLLQTLNHRHRPLRAIALGVAGGLGIAASLQFAISLLIGQPVTNFGTETYLFWLGLPALFHITAAAAGSWYMNQLIKQLPSTKSEINYVNTHPVPRAS